MPPSLGKRLFQVLCPFNRIICVCFCSRVVGVLYVFWGINPFTDRCMVCKYLFPLLVGSFHVVDRFFGCAAAFLFDVVPPAYFCVWCQIRKAIAKMDLTQEPTTYAFSWEFHGLRPHIFKPLIHSALNFASGVRRV